MAEPLGLRGYGWAVRISAKPPLEQEQEHESEHEGEGKGDESPLTFHFSLLPANATRHTVPFPSSVTRRAPS